MSLGQNNLDRKSHKSWVNSWGQLKRFRTEGPLSWTGTITFTDKPIADCCRWLHCRQEPKASRPIAVASESRRPLYGVASNPPSTGRATPLTKFAPGPAR